MAKRVKDFDGKAKVQLKKVMSCRHSNPQIAAQNLRRLIGHFSPDIVWEQVSRTNPHAVDELKALLKTYNVGSAA